MSHLVPCPACARHVRHHELSCPFCGEQLALARVPPPALPRTRLGRAATFAFRAGVVGAATLVSCSSEDNEGAPVPMYGAPTASFGGSPVYGAPPSAGAGNASGGSSAAGSAGDAGAGGDTPAGIGGEGVGGEANPGAGGEAIAGAGGQSDAGAGGVGELVAAYGGPPPD